MRFPALTHFFVLFLSSIWVFTFQGRLAHAQILPGASESYTRKNSLAAYVSYANDSSPILLGSSVNRKLAALGVDYARRIWLRPSFNLQYLAELTPFTLESDPTEVFTNTYITGSSSSTFSSSDRSIGACKPRTLTVSGVTDQGVPTQTNVNISCKRTYTYGQGLSPLGLRLNLFPKHRIQPLIEGVGGYLFSTQPVPISEAGSFNFTFSIGVGFEVYRASTGESSFFGNRSLTAEYRYSHLSNANTAEFNPGIDAGAYLVRFAFGR